MSVSWLNCMITYKWLKLGNLLLHHLQLDPYDHVVVLFSPPCEPSPYYYYMQPSLLCCCRLEAEWEMENSQRVMDTYCRANTLVRYAMIINKITTFKVFLHSFVISDNTYTKITYRYSHNAHIMVLCGRQLLFMCSH